MRLEIERFTNHPQFYHSLSAAVDSDIARSGNHLAAAGQARMFAAIGVAPIEQTPNFLGALHAADKRLTLGAPVQPGAQKKRQSRFGQPVDADAAVDHLRTQLAPQCDQRCTKTVHLPDHAQVK